MRVSEGSPYGRFAEPYNIEMFEDHEEVIVFTRDEFHRMYNSIQEHIGKIEKIYLHFEIDEDWKLMGYWPQIMDEIYILDKNIDLIFKKEKLQCYLDAHIYNQSSNVRVIADKVINTKTVPAPDFIF